MCASVRCFALLDWYWEIITVLEFPRASQGGRTHKHHRDFSCLTSFFLFLGGEDPILFFGFWLRQPPHRELFLDFKNTHECGQGAQ